MGWIVFHVQAHCYHLSWKSIHSLRRKLRIWIWGKNERFCDVVRKDNLYKLFSLNINSFELVLRYCIACSHDASRHLEIKKFTSILWTKEFSGCTILSYHFREAKAIKNVSRYQQLAVNEYWLDNFSVAISFTCSLVDPEKGGNVFCVSGTSWYPVLITV